jgi:hypothetical protein
MKAEDYQINDKVDYYAYAGFKWHGLIIKRSRMYLHGYIKAICGDKFYIKTTSAERVDVVPRSHIFGKLERKSKTE